MTAARLTRNRATIAAAVVIAMALSAVVAYAIAATGYPARHVDLNDGGIWVTKDSAGLTGRLNKPIAQLDAGFFPPGGAQAAFSLDVVQDGAAVLTWDRGTGRLYPVDVALGAPVSGDAVAVPNSYRLALAGSTAAVLDPKTGRVWAVRTDGDSPPTVAGLDPTLKPIAVAGPDADLAVTTKGTVLAVSGAQHRLLSISAREAGFAPAVFADLGPVIVEPTLTAVGERPVVLDRAASRVYYGSGSATRLTTPDRNVALLQSGADAAVQVPGPDADAVYVATDSDLERVDLTSPTVTRVTAAGPGTPARPTVLGRCVHAAWSGRPGTYARACDRDPAQVLPLTKGGELVRPVFRVNRNQIVLNDQETGAVYVIDGVPQRVDNWDAVKPPPTKTNDNDKNSNPNTQTLSAQDRAPKANPDSVGARPGRTNVIYPLDNDSDADGDILSIVSLTQPSMTGASTVVAPDGQTVQVALPTSAAGTFAFGYTIDDGRGHRASSTVQVTVRGPGTDNPPRTRAGYVNKARTVAANATFEQPVLADWRDDDSDPVVLTGATTTAGVVTATADGRLLLDAPATAGPATMTYTVADGFGGEKAAPLRVQVLSPDGTDATAPIAEPDVVRATVNTPLPIRPLANDVPGSDPTDADAVIELSAAVPAPAGMSVSTDTQTGIVTVTALRKGTFQLGYGAFFGSSTVSRGQIRIDATDQATAAPIITVPDSAVLHGQQAAIADVLANDFDPAGAVMVVQQAGAPGATDGLEVAIISGRWLRIVSRVPAYDGPRTVRYTVQDGVSPPATGEVTVTQLPEPPVDAAPIPQDDQAVVRAGDSVTVPALDNDLDPDGDPLQLVPGEVRVTSGGGSADVYGNGVRFSAPAAVATVTQAILDYVVTDPAGTRATGHITVRINPASDAAHDQPPQAKAVEAAVVSGDTRTITIPTTGVDPDGDSVTVIGLDSPPSLGRVLGVGANSIRYQAYPSTTGVDHLTYVVQDRYGLTARAIVRIGVVAAGPFQPPVAVNDTITAAPHTAVRVAILANDFETPGDDVSVLPLARTNGSLAGGATLTGDHVRVLTPDLTARPITVAYGLTDGTAPASVAQVVVRTKAGYDNPPVARDDDAKVPASGDTATVDVLANDDDADGPLTALRLDPSTDPSVHVVGNRLTVTIGRYPRTVPYTVRDSGGATAIGAVHVPGSGAGAPSLRPDVQTIRLDKGQNRTVSVGDYVTSSDGTALRLTTKDRIWSSPVGGLAAAAKGDGSLVLRAIGEYVGPAAVTFEVSDSAPGAAEARTAVVTVPVQIGPVTPVLRCPPTTFTLVEGGSPLALDVVTLCHVWTASPDDLAAITFTAAWSTAIDAVQLAQSGDGGRVVSVTAGGAARPGRTAVLTVGARGTSARSTLNIVVATAPLAQVAPITVEGARAGVATTVDVRSYLSTAIADPTVRVVSIQQTSGLTSTQSRNDSSISITPGADTHGAMTYTYSVTDVASRADRAITGTITLQVLGKPATPTTPTITTVRGHTAVVAFATPAANGSPISGYQLSDGSRTTSCPASPCTVTGLTNGRAYRFQVRAVNAIGAGDYSPASAPKIPDEVPDAPTGLTATPGDRQVRAQWAAAGNEGSPVDYYLLQTSPGTGSSAKVAGPSRVVTGLTNGTSYQLRVLAHNRQGYSPASAWVPAIPFGRPVTPGPPDASTGSASTAAKERTIAVSWSAADGNGRQIQSYAVTMRRDGAVVTTRTVGGASTGTTFVVTTSGSKYTFSLTATNAGALSSASSPPSSPPVDVSTVPDQMEPPTNVTATGTSGQVTLQFASPAGNGAAIEQYEVRDNAGGTQSCPGSPCTVQGLSNGQSYTFTARAHNKNGWGDYSGDSGAATPYAPPDTPNAKATSNGSQANPAITFSWSGGGGNGRPIDHYVVSIDGVASNHAGADSITRNYGNSETHRISVYVVNTAGQKSAGATDSARTEDPKPPDPKSLTLSRGPSATSQPNCSSVYCHYLVVTPHNMGSGSWQYDCYQGGSVFSSGEAAFSNGSSTQLYCYNGYAEAVYVRINGVSSNTVHPKPDWG